MNSSVPKLDFAALEEPQKAPHPSKPYSKQYNSKEFNVRNVDKQKINDTARSNGTTLSWGTHAGSVAHNQCHHIYFRKKSDLQGTRVKERLDASKGPYVLQKEPVKQKAGHNIAVGTRDREEPVQTPPKLDLAEVKKNFKRPQKEILKITISPRNLQMIDLVADKHLTYLKTIKMDEAVLRSLDSRLTARGDREQGERQRVIRDSLDIIIADQLSCGALSSRNQISVSSPSNGFIPGSKMPSRPIRNQSRRLHDTNVAPSGLQNEASLRDRIVFLGRFIAPQEMVLKQLIGVHFNGDNSTLIYEYGGFGDSRKELRAWPVIKRGSFQLNADNFEPGKRLVFGDRKFQIDFVEGYGGQSRWNLMSDSARGDGGGEIEKIRNVLRTEIVHSRRIASIVFTLRYESTSSNYADAIESTGIHLSDKSVWKSLVQDLDNDGQHDSLELIQALFGHLPISRITTIRTAWLAIDNSKSGIIERNLLERTSNMARIDKQLLSDFADSIGNSKMCTYDAFYHFYFALSKMIPDDQDFQVLMKALWPF